LKLPEPALNTAVEVFTAPRRATVRAKAPRRAMDVGWGMGMEMMKPLVSVAGLVMAGDQFREEDHLRRT
jgi:hypothetical protein